MPSLEYAAPGEVARNFFVSEAFVRGLRGPVGSGKSVACCIEVWRRAVQQEPGTKSGLRKTRFAVIRNTAPELKTTTVKTWLEWFPENQYGKFNWSPPFTHHIKVGQVDCEVIFLALDKPEDVKKLLSLELTGAFINESREIPKSVVDAVTMRVGRYPSRADGGPTWKGVIMDTNSPDEDHWWSIMSGDCPPPEFMTEEERRALVKPEGWEFFSQPGAMMARKNNAGEITEWVPNPKRENKAGVDNDYYRKMIPGKTTNWVQVYVANEYGSIDDGKPIYPQFDRMLHVSPEPIARVGGALTYIGIDFGLTPSAVFAQQSMGKWYILREIVAVDMGTVQFAEILNREMQELGGKFSIWGDPAGDQRAQTDKQTPFQILRAANIMARPAPTNDPQIRIESVQQVLTRLVDKTPALQIDPRCKTIIKGFEGGYHYRRLQVSGRERYDQYPNKNRFSHPHDALQYLFLGGGEGRKLLRTPTDQKVRQLKTRAFDPFSGKKKAGKKSPLSRLFR